MQQRYWWNSASLVQVQSFVGHDQRDLGGSFDTDGVDYGKSSGQLFDQCYWKRCQYFGSEQWAAGAQSDCDGDGGAELYTCSYHVKSSFGGDRKYVHVDNHSDTCEWI